MFNGCSNLKNINGLANWNVSKIQQLGSMFMNCTSLEDATGINNWNIYANTIYTMMFYNTPVHPTFTKFSSGTWDSNKTFTPNA